MLLVPLYILSVPLQEASELPIVLVLHDHIFQYLSISYKQNSVLLSILVAEVFDLHTVEQ